MSTRKALHRLMLTTSVGMLVVLAACGGNTTPAPTASAT